MTPYPIVVIPLGCSPAQAMEYCGCIPQFLDGDDARGARAQFADKYIGGWFPASAKAKLNATNVMTYPGDPPLPPVAMIPFRDETIFIYPYGFVCVKQKDGSYEIARMD